MFGSSLLGKVHQPYETITKQYELLGKLFQHQTVQNRPHLGTQHRSANVNNAYLHTCHFVSFREIYTHILTTILNQEETKSDSKDIQKRLTQYCGTMFRGRTSNCSHAIIFLIYLIYTFDKHYGDKKLPILQNWASNKRVNEAFRRFWMEVYNHGGNMMKNGHPRTNLMIRSRRDLVYVNGAVCETTHSKLGKKWNSQIKSLSKEQNPSIHNLPVVPNDFIGTKYTSVISGGVELSQEQLNNMLLNGWFVLSSHPTTFPRYQLKLSPDSKQYLEVFDQNYYSRDNDNFDVKISSRSCDVELHPNNLSPGEKVTFKNAMKEIISLDYTIPATTKENYEQYDVDTAPLNQTAECVPAPCEEMSFVYAGYVVHTAVASTPRSRSRSIFSFLKSKD
jgi:hypothetical protein